MTRLGPHHQQLSSTSMNDCKIRPVPIDSTITRQPRDLAIPRNRCRFERSYANSGVTVGLERLAAWHRTHSINRLHPPP